MNFFTNKFAYGKRKIPEQNPGKFYGFLVVLTVISCFKAGESVNVTEIGDQSLRWLFKRETSDENFKVLVLQESL